MISDLEKNKNKNIDFFDDMKGRKKIDDSYDDENDLFIKNDKFFNAKFEDILEFIASKDDKLIEEEWRKNRIEEIKYAISHLNRDKYYDALKTKKINEILVLKNSRMNDEKFKVLDDKSTLNFSKKKN